MAGHDSGREIRLPGPSRRLVLFGDPVGLPQSLRARHDAEVVAVVGAAIRPAQHDAVAALADGIGVPFLVQPRRSDAAYPAFVERVSRLAPDLILVNSYSMILAPDLLAVPRHGAVNVHGALLPAYRGANPTEWALINGEQRTGVTIHALDAGIDTGPIIAQRAVPIRFEDTWLDVQRRVHGATDTLLAATLPAILSGDATACPQDAASGRHWRRRDAKDGCFSWSLPAIDIYNLVRALVAPHPGACADGATFTSWQSLPSVIWRKFAAGAGAEWSCRRWRLVPRRPQTLSDRRRANATIDLDMHVSAGGAIGSCRINGVSEPSGPVRAVIEHAPRSRLAGKMRSELQAMVARFAESELRRDVAFV
jgi:methionyl-tRNA formyltransferase